MSLLVLLVATGTPTQVAANEALSLAARAFIDVCVGGFPDASQTKRRAAAHGLSSPSAGIWKGRNFWIDMRGKASGTGKCTLFIEGRATQRDLADALQPILTRMQVQDLKATRRGQNLNVTFSKGGTKGVFKTARVAGVSAGATLRLLGQGN